MSDDKPKVESVFGAGLSLTLDLQALEQRAHKLGLHVTGHAINRAVQSIGWERSGDIVRAGEAAGGARP